MDVKVVYHSGSGNTKKVADAIAAAVNVQAVSILDIQDPASLEADLLFIGDGMYIGSISGAMKNFINALDSQKIRRAAVFNTSGGNWWFGPNGIKKRLRKVGISVANVSFRCHGNAFGILFSSHPDAKDLENAKTFAERTVAAM